MKITRIFRKGKAGIISKLMYIAAGILAVLSIKAAGSVAYDSMYYTERVKGYTLETLDSDFYNGDYGELNKKIAYNKAIGRTITDDERDYYLFSDYYESIINYNVYKKNGDELKAMEQLKNADTYYNQMKHKIFKEKADELEESVNIN